MSNTTADKLQLLMNTKNSIRTALINKGQTVNVSDTFSSYSAKIENIETGINTSDATAIASDILEGKTAYVNGVKLTGTMENLTDVIANQTNIINELEAELNDKSGLTFSVPDGMKFGYSKISELPNLDFSKTTGMEQTFAYCSNLVYVSNLNTINATSMHALFQSCFKLKNVSNIATSNVTTMYAMFTSCYNLTSVSQLNTSNVVNMQQMFQSCGNLTSAPNFDTSNVIDMAYMFSGCRNLTTVPNFDTSKVTIMSYMFQSCNNLSNESIQNIVNMCISSNITDITLKNLNNTNNYSPLYRTKFDSSYYSNRLAELDAAGWTY